MSDGEPDMIDGYPRGPNGLADVCRDQLAEIDAALAAKPSKVEAAKLRRRRATCKMLIGFATTRAGYVKPTKAQADG